MSEELEPFGEYKPPWNKSIIIFKDGVRIETGVAQPSFMSDPCKDFELKCHGCDATSGRRWVAMSSLLMRGRVR